MKDDIVLKVEGKKFSGWTELEVNQSLDSLSASFAFSYTENYPDQMDVFSFKKGQEAIVEINGYRLVTGHIEEVEKKYTASSHTLQVRGRDKLGDLIDCPWWKEGQPATWSGLTVENLIKKLCEPFGIEVVVDESAREITSQVKSSFTSKEGDTVADCLARLIKEYAFLPVGYGDGKLTLTTSITDKKCITSIVSGKNVLEGALIESDMERYKYYICKGQGDGDDLIDLESIVAPYGKKEDKGIDRYRPLILIMDSETDIKRCQARSEWEETIRRGKSSYCNYTLSGWLQEDGTPFPLNILYSVSDKINKVENTLLSSSISYKLSQSSGRIFEITLVDKDTYKILVSSSLEI